MFLDLYGENANAVGINGLPEYLNQGYALSVTAHIGIEKGKGIMN